MTKVVKTIVDDSEQVARIVSNEWVIDGVLMPPDMPVNVTRFVLLLMNKKVGRFLKNLENGLLSCKTRFNKWFPIS